MKHLRLLLFPFSLIYGLVITIRNLWYFGFNKNRYIIPVKSIVIGNLSTGGTGKTPFTEFLISKFHSPKTAVLSRGYGRKTKGYLEVNKEQSGFEVGDEPLQMSRKFKDTHFHVCEKREEGVKQILQSHPDTNLILLDDAYQHLSVQAGFYVLLSTYRQPFYHDFLIPSGNLREFRNGARRANAIVISKCPETITEAEKEKIIQKVRKYSSSPVYFTYTSYADIDRVYQGKNNNKGNCLVTGIASDHEIKGYFSEQGVTIDKHFRFKDHHHFSEEDIFRIGAYCMNASLQIITTEKDYTRLQSAGIHRHFPQISIHTLPIKVVFCQGNEDPFMQQISNFTNS